MKTYNYLARSEGVVGDVDDVHDRRRGHFLVFAGHGRPAKPRGVSRAKGWQAPRQVNDTPYAATRRQETPTSCRRARVTCMSDRNRSMSDTVRWSVSWWRSNSWRTSTSQSTNIARIPTLMSRWRVMYPARGRRRVCREAGGKREKKRGKERGRIGEKGQGRRAC